MKILDWTLVVGFFSIVVVSVIFLVNVRSEEGQCIANPLEYAIKKYEAALNTDMMCTCGFEDQKYQTMIVTSNGSYPLEQSGSADLVYPSINWTEEIGD